MIRWWKSRSSLLTRSKPGCLFIPVSSRRQALPSPLTRRLVQHQFSFENHDMMLYESVVPLILEQWVLTAKAASFYNQQAGAECPIADILTFEVNLIIAIYPNTRVKRGLVVETTLSLPLTQANPEHLFLYLYRSGGKCCLWLMVIKRDWGPCTQWCVLPHRG